MHTSSSKKWFSFLLKKQHLVLLIIIFSCLGVAMYLGHLLPQYIASLFETYQDEQLFFEVIKFLLYIYVAEYLNRVIYTTTTTRYVQRVLLDVRVYCYREWLLSYDTQRSNKREKEFPMGEVLARLMNDTEAIRELISSGALNIFVNMLFLISCLYGFIQIDQISGLFLTGVELVLVAVLIWSSRSLAQIFMRVRKEWGIFSRTVVDVVGGMGENYYNNAGRYAQKKTVKQFQKFLKEQLWANLADEIYHSVAESFYPILLIMVGAIFSYYPLILGGVIVAVIDLAQRSIEPIKEMMGKMSSIQRALVGMRRINEFILHLQHRLQTDNSLPSAEGEFQSLDVRVNTFSYPLCGQDRKAFVLRNIRFQGKRGDILGIVGLSGSGKSTLLKILSCDLLPEQGELIIQTKDHAINFDFKDMAKLQNYRNQVSIVSQDSHVFTASLAFNIAMDTESDESVERYWESVKSKIAYLDFWGISPKDEIRPRELSTGQKQLISALRACYLRRPVVLFDEISSSLDSALELALRKLVLLVQKQALTIIVAHRIETLVYAQKILVMDQGEIIAEGDHCDLINISALYRDFIRHLRPSKNDFPLLLQNEDQAL